MTYDMSHCNFENLDIPKRIFFKKKWLELIMSYNLNLRWCKCEQQKKKSIFFLHRFFYQNSRKNKFKFIFSNVFPKTAEKKIKFIFSNVFPKTAEKKY